MRPGAGRGPSATRGDHGPVVFFCRFPPPVTGQTVATRTFAELLEEGGVPVVRLDISDGRLHLRRGLGGALRRAGSAVGALLRLRSTRGRCGASTVYFVPSSSVGGQLRDLLHVLGMGRRVRVVAHVHSGNLARIFSSPSRRAVARVVVGRVDRFLFLSEGLRAGVAGRIPPERTAVVPNTVRRELELGEEELEGKWVAARERGGLRVGFVGHLLESKGVWETLDGVRMARQEVEASLALVGGWPDRASEVRFQAWAERHGAAAWCTHHGEVRDTESLRELYRGMDVLALPSRYPQEAQPLVVLEAMAAGAAVVASRQGGLGEIMDGTGVGRVVQPGSAEAVAEALVGLRGRVQEHGRRARALFEERFGRAEVAARLREAMGFGEASPRRREGPPPEGRGSHTPTPPRDGPDQGGG